MTSQDADMTVARKVPVWEVGVVWVFFEAESIFWLSKRVAVTTVINHTDFSQVV